MRIYCRLFLLDYGTLVTDKFQYICFFCSRSEQHHLSRLLKVYWKSLIVKHCISRVEFIVSITHHISVKDLDSCAMILKIVSTDPYLLRILVSLVTSWHYLYKNVNTKRMFKFIVPVKQHYSSNIIQLIIINVVINSIPFLGTTSNCQQSDEISI